MAKKKKNTDISSAARVQCDWNCHTTLVTMQNDMAISENGLAASYQVKHLATI